MGSLCAASDGIANRGMYSSFDASCESKVVELPGSQQVSPPGNYGRWTATR
jgi:hypothetical protein